MEATALSPRQAKFIDEYLIDSNGTQAAIRAGYSATGARVAAHRLLTNVAVSSLIEARRRADATKLCIDRENVLVGLLEAIEIAREQQNPAGMIAGFREIAKLQGYYAPAAVKLDLDVAAVAERGRLDAMTDAELLAVAGGV